MPKLEQRQLSDYGNYIIDVLPARTETGWTYSMKNYARPTVAVKYDSQATKVKLSASLDRKFPTPDFGRLKMVGYAIDVIEGGVKGFDLNKR